MDLQAIGRAVLHNLTRDGRPQGGSTLTQQLAKRLLVQRDPRPSLSRKLSEVVLAVELEHRLTKDEILQLYLDEVYLGDGVSGLAEAAQHYFGTVPGSLTLAEGALLAGIPAAPTAHGPFTDPDGAMRRRTQVLDQMQAHGWVTAAAAAAAAATPLPVRPR